MLFEGLNYLQGLGNLNGAAAIFVFGWLKKTTSLGRVGQRLSHRKGTGLKVYVFPLEAQ